MFPGERQGSFIPKLLAERKGLWDIFILKQQQHHCCYLHRNMILLKSLTDSVSIHFNYMVKRRPLRKRSVLNCIECVLSVHQILIVYLKAELVDNKILLK